MRPQAFISPEHEEANIKDDQQTNDSEAFADVGIIAHLEDDPERQHQRNNLANV
jgi:hypothetical protein